MVILVTACIIVGGFIGYYIKYQTPIPNSGAVVMSQTKTPLLKEYSMCSKKNIKGVIERGIVLDNTCISTQSIPPIIDIGSPQFTLMLYACNNGTYAYAHYESMGQSYQKAVDGIMVTCNLVVA